MISSNDCNLETQKFWAFSGIGQENKVCCEYKRGFGSHRAKYEHSSFKIVQILVSDFVGSF